MERVGLRRTCPECDNLFFICASCDRWHWYCGPACKKKARVASVRRASSTYRGSEKGRHANRRAQEIFRNKQKKVRDHSSRGQPQDLSLPTISVINPLETRESHESKLPVRTSEVIQQSSQPADAGGESARCPSVRSIPFGHCCVCGARISRLRSEQAYPGVRERRRRGIDHFGKNSS